MNPSPIIHIPRIESTPLDIGNHLPLTFICGPCQLESRGHALETAEFLRDVFKRAGAGFIYKTSFDKANRSSIKSYRGPGLKDGLAMLTEVKKQLNVPIATDIHEVDQAAPVAAVADDLGGVAECGGDRHEARGNAVGNGVRKALAVS